MLQSLGLQRVGHGSAAEQQTHLYPVYLLKKEEPGQEPGQKSSGQSCFSEVTTGQSSGVVVVTHFRCRNQYLEHGTQARKQDLSHLLEITALNPSAGYLYHLSHAILYG